MRKNGGKIGLKNAQILYFISHSFYHLHLIQLFFYSFSLLWLFCLCGRHIKVQGKTETAGRCCHLSYQCGAQLSNYPQRRRKTLLLKRKMMEQQTAL